VGFIHRGRLATWRVDSRLAIFAVGGVLRYSVLNARYRTVRRKAVNRIPVGMAIS
jgi:hypothetical protein